MIIGTVNANREAIVQLVMLRDDRSLESGTKRSLKRA